MIAIKLRCPHCKSRVKTLIGGLRQEYAGRQKVCVSCGAIWRYDRQHWQEFVAVFVVLTAGGAFFPYLFMRPAAADLWCVGWLAFCMVILWPVVYYILWKCKLRR